MAFGQSGAMFEDFFFLSHVQSLTVVLDGFSLNNEVLKIKLEDRRPYNSTTPLEKPLQADLCFTEYHYALVLIYLLWCDSCMILTVYSQIYMRGWVFNVCTVLRIEEMLSIGLLWLYSARKYY